MVGQESTRGVSTGINVLTDVNYFGATFGIPCSTSTDTESSEAEDLEDPGRFTVATSIGRTALLIGVLLGF